MSSCFLFTIGIVHLNHPILVYQNPTHLDPPTVFNMVSNSDVYVGSGHMFILECSESQ